MKTLPPDVVPYRRTAEFTEATIPAGLRRRHTTQPGVWGRICVLEGALRYDSDNVAAHLAQLLYQVGVDLEAAMGRFADGCPKCGASPCRCLA